MACGGAEEGQRRSRVPWREGRACSEKPVEEQSKLASVTRSLMASSTWRRREPAERRRGGAPGGAEVRRGRAFFSRLPCVSRASNLGTRQRRSSCQRARDAHGDLRKKSAVRFATSRNFSLARTFERVVPPSGLRWLPSCGDGHSAAWLLPPRRPSASLAAEGPLRRVRRRRAPHAHPRRRGDSLHWRGGGGESSAGGWQRVC